MSGESEHLVHAASKTAQSLANPYQPGMKFIWNKWLSEKDAIKRCNEIADEIRALGPLIVMGVPRERTLPYKNIRLAPPEEMPSPGEVVLRYKVIDAESWGCSTMTSEGFIATTVLCFLAPPLMFLPCCLGACHSKIQIPIYGRAADLPARKLLINEDEPRSPAGVLTPPEPLSPRSMQPLELEKDTDAMLKEKSGIQAVTAPFVDAFTAIGTGVQKNVLDPTLQTVTHTGKSAKVGMERITQRLVSLVDYDAY